MWFYAPLDTKQVISETFPKPIYWLDMEKKLNQTQQSAPSSIKRNVLQDKINTKKLKPGLVAFQDIRPGNGVGLFSKEKISRRQDK